MLDVQLLLDCVVRVVNDRTRAIIEEHRDLSESDAYRLARQLAERLADDYGDDEAHAKREFPFVPSLMAPFDPYTVVVLQREDSGMLNWRGSRDVTDGLVTANGRCAY